MSSVTPQERNNPTPETFDELLELLAAANEEGQLVSLVFSLRNGDSAVIDYRGTPENTELACRTVAGRIADLVQHQHPLIAEQIRRDLAKGKH